MKIGVMGTGGVGGYFGGLLARDGHDVTFVARGAHLAAIQQHGLKVESTNDGSFMAPGKAVDETSKVGPQDLVLFNVKMFQNAPAIGHFRRCRVNGGAIALLGRCADQSDENRPDMRIDGV